MSKMYIEKTICGKKDLWLELSKLKINSLPKNFNCPYSLDCEGSSIKELPEGLIVEGNLYIGECDITKLPNKLTIGKDLILLNSSIFELPNDICIGGNIIALKVENVPKYSLNTVEEQYVCDINGKIIAYKNKKNIHRTHRFDLCFYLGKIEGQCAVSFTDYNKKNIILACNDFHEGQKKAEYYYLKHSPIYSKYLNYDVNKKRSHTELKEIFREVTQACVPGVYDYLRASKIIIKQKKYSIKELNDILNQEINNTQWPFLFIFEDYFFHREKFDNL